MANKVLPGLGYVVAFLIVAGGLVFNIGNVGGGALGFNTLLGIPTTAGYFLAGAIAVLVFLFKNALKAMDTLTKVLGGPVYPLFSHRKMQHFQTRWIRLELLSPDSLCSEYHFPLSESQRYALQKILR